MQEKNDLNERVKSLMQQKDLSPSAFADLIGVPRASISHILSDRNKPSLELIQKILRSFATINPYWLMFGEGKIEMPLEKVEAFITSKDKKDKEVEQKLGIEENNPLKEPFSEILPTTKTNINKAVEKIIIFYADKTFDIFHNT